MSTLDWEDRDEPERAPGDQNRLGGCEHTNTFHLKILEALL